MSTQSENNDESALDILHAWAEKEGMDTLAESPASISLPLVKPRLPHAFTRENAAEFTKKGLAARAANRKARLEKATINGDSYVQTRLSRVRAQLSKLDKMIDEEQDPQKLDRLVCAQNRLSEQWRIFSGIPLPGSRRPGRESTSKRSGEVGPVE